MNKKDKIKQMLIEFLEGKDDGDITFLLQNLGIKRDEIYAFERTLSSISKFYNN